MASSNDTEVLVRLLSSSALTLGARFTLFHELDREWGADRDSQQWTGALRRWASTDDAVAIRSQTFQHHQRTVSWTANTAC